MSRYTTMTLGFLLVFLGIKFNTVQSYLLSPRATQFWMERIEDAGIGSFAPVNQFTTDISGRPNVFSGVPQQNIVGASNGSANRTIGSNAFQQGGGSDAYQRGTGFNSWGPYINQGYRAPVANGRTTPTPTQFQNAAFTSPTNAAFNVSQGSISPWGQKVITPPNWLGWPILFLGAVFIIYGAMRR